jgi:hypothetical protein
VSRVSTGLVHAAGADIESLKQPRSNTGTPSTSTAAAAPTRLCYAADVAAGGLPMMLMGTEWAQGGWWSCTGAHDLSPLSTLTRLESLVLSEPSRAELDLCPISSGLPQLKSLDLCHNYGLVSPPPRGRSCRSCMEAGPTGSAGPAPSASPSSPTPGAFRWPTRWVGVGSVRRPGRHSRPGAADPGSCRGSARDLGRVSD